MTAAIDRGLRRGRDRHRHPAPDRGQDVARRAARPVHDDARRRPGRPVRHASTTPSSCARSSASRGRAASRTSSSGGGATSSSADAGVRGLVIQDRAEGVAGRRRALHRRGRRADGPGRDRDAAGRPDRASSSAWRSRARSAAPCGPTPARTSRTSRPSSNRRASSTRRHARRSLTAADLGAGLPRQPLQARRRRGPPPSSSLEATFRLDAGRCRRRSRRGSTRSGAGGRPTSRWAAVGRQRLPQPARRLGRAADRGGRAQGHADRRRRRLREARQLHRQRPEGHRRRRPPPRRSTSGPGRRASAGVELAARDRVRRRLVAAGRGAAA